ncbi:MAG: phenylalanine--tRNA ligase subunit alpha, partial [Alphaproteobacteria bacterium]|nr:phenylalanine--tRNA ligase subunit alpha [Alphaproteobacteria bacterium]
MSAPDPSELQESLLADVSAAESLDALEAVRVAALGKKGAITAQMKGLGQLDGDARKEAGQALNRIKDAVAAAIAARQAELDAVALEARLAEETVDVTLPPRPRAEGHLHPVSQVTEECIAIFGEMGFTVAEGPDIEDDFHNFTALNIPPEHPARQMHDTFYLNAEEGRPAPVLRTHTSPVQIRTMETSKPPIRIVAPGRTYRSDSDAT